MNRLSLENLGGHSLKVHSTRVLQFVASVHLAFPLVYLISTALVFRMSTVQIVGLLLSSTFYATCVVSVLAGWGLRNLRRWGWYAYTVANFIIGYQTALIAVGNTTDQSVLIPVLFTYIIQFGSYFWVTRELRVPYFLPRIQWWESDPAKKIAIPVVIERTIEAPTAEGSILDISIEGCFIKTQERFELEEGVQIEFRLKDQKFSCAGDVVWLPQPAVTHPRGIGVKFTHVEKPVRKKLRGAITSLRSVS